MKFNITRDWCLQDFDIERRYNVSAGVPDLDVESLGLDLPPLRAVIVPTLAELAGPEFRALAMTFNSREFFNDADFQMMTGTSMAADAQALSEDITRRLLADMELNAWFYQNPTTAGPPAAPATFADLREWCRARPAPKQSKIRYYCMSELTAEDYGKRMREFFRDPAPFGFAAIPVKVSQYMPDGLVLPLNEDGEPVAWDT